MSFFEIYGGRCQDLLNERHRLMVREDGKGDVVIGELQESEAQTEEELIGLIEEVGPRGHVWRSKGVSGSKGGQGEGSGAPAMIVI